LLIEPHDDQKSIYKYLFKFVKQEPQYRKS
jgi:hypothetical protein